MSATGQLVLPLVEHRGDSTVRGGAQGSDACLRRSVRHDERAVGRTIVQVSRTIRRSISDTEELLHELEESGIACEVDRGVWRLTDDAERRFGRVFRELPAWVDGGSV